LEIAVGGFGNNTRDGEGPDLRTYDFMFDSRWKQVILASSIQDRRMKQKSCLISNVQNIPEIGLFLCHAITK
jgi:hypothetical protein